MTDKLSLYTRTENPVLVRLVMAHTNRIEAIRDIRTLTGVGLVDAKNFVEDVLEQQGDAEPDEPSDADMEAQREAIGRAEERYRADMIDADRGHLLK